MSDQFFNNPNQEPQGEPDAPEKVKVGEKEYSQDDLNRLVGLGEKSQQLEKDWNRKIDDLYPEFTRRSQELAEYKKRETEAKEAEVKKRAEDGQLSEEEKLEVAKKTLKDLGFIDRGAFEEEARRLYQSQREAEKLVDQVDKTIEDFSQKGLPKPSREDLLQHMLETGFKNPEKAYKDKYEKEVDQWKESQLNKIRPSSFVTQSTSTAGSKKPEEVKVNRENMEDLMRAVLHRE